MAAIRCALCGKDTQYGAERPRFCAHCAQKLPDDAGADARDILERARAQDDTHKRYQILLEGREKLGELFETEREILYLGRLHERGGKPDFYRIPYWPLNALERPKEFSARERKKMLDTFFENPEIARVGALSPDPDAFRDEYFQYMAREYVKLFIMGNRANSQILGFRRRQGEVTRRCAMCMAGMLERLEVTGEVNEGDRPRVGRALFRAFAGVLEAEGGEGILREICASRLGADFMRAISMT